MKHFMIKYQFANGTTDEWHQEIEKFISALDNDAELKGKISYRCLKNRDDANYTHLAAATDEQAIKTLQARDFFKHYTENGSDKSINPADHSSSPLPLWEARPAKRAWRWHDANAVSIVTGEGPGLSIGAVTARPARTTHSGRQGIGGVLKKPIYAVTLFHEARSRERAGDDGTDIDRATLRLARWLRSMVKRLQRPEHRVEIRRPRRARSCRWNWFRSFLWRRRSYLL